MVYRKSSVFLIIFPEKVIERLMNGTRDPEMMRRSRERMDRMREDLRQRIGTVEVAVDLIRDARDA